MSIDASSFMTKLIDWKSFELFAADLYKEGDDVIVEHNIMEVGKTNARYQIDVKVTKKDKLHTYTTLVECKRWKGKVDRGIVNILFTMMEDLNASKGVIFTTKGYESGAIEYAKSKGIDIFIVRDLTEEEWGKPGKTFSIYLQMFCAEVRNFRVEVVGYHSPTGLPPKMPLNLDFTLTDKKEYDDKFTLYSFGGEEKNPNLLNLIFGAQNQMVKDICHQFNTLLQPADEDCQIAYTYSVKMDITANRHKHLKHEDGFVAINSVLYDEIIGVNQNKMTFDRTQSLDFALIVENYITKQRNYALKSKTEDKLVLSEPIQLNDIDDSDIVKDGLVMKLMLEPYIPIGLKPNATIHKINDVVIGIKED